MYSAEPDIGVGAAMAANNQPEKDLLMNQILKIAGIFTRQMPTHTLFLF